MLFFAPLASLFLLACATVVQGVRVRELWLQRLRGPVGGKRLP